MSYSRYPSVALACVLFILSFTSSSTALRFDQQYIDYNLNQNQTATEVSDFAGAWDNHTYFPSPSNWRIPFYTLFLDKFVNGDPTNDDTNGTTFEHDAM
jgi:alpha-1,3-glucan synthase